MSENCQFGNVKNGFVLRAEKIRIQEKITNVLPSLSSFIYFAIVCENDDKNKPIMFTFFLILLIQTNLGPYNEGLANPVIPIAKSKFTPNQL